MIQFRCFYAYLTPYVPFCVDSKCLIVEINVCSILRLGAKKPGGTAEEIEKYFGCPASSLVMVKIEFISCLFSQLLYFVSAYLYSLSQVGDRILTDIVYGNRHGFLTILTEPLSLAEEPFIVKKVIYGFLWIT